MKWYEIFILLIISYLIICIYDFYKEKHISKIPSVIKDGDGLILLLLIHVLLCSLYNSLIYYFFNKSNNDPSYFYLLDLFIVFFELIYDIIFYTNACVSKFVPNRFIRCISKITDKCYDLCYCDKLKEYILM